MHITSVKIKCQLTKDVPITNYIQLYKKAGFGLK